jgi:hypothetical protein
MQRLCQEKEQEIQATHDAERVEILDGRDKIGRKNMYIGCARDKNKSAGQGDQTPSGAAISSGP